jgi:hypothetical protein
MKRTRSTNSWSDDYGAKIFSGQAGGCDFDRWFLPPVAGRHAGQRREGLLGCRLQSPEAYLLGRLSGGQGGGVDGFQTPPPCHLAIDPRSFRPRRGPSCLYALGTASLA